MPTIWTLVNWWRAGRITALSTSSRNMPSICSEGKPPTSTLPGRNIFSIFFLYTFSIEWKDKIWCTKSRGLGGQFSETSTDTVTTWLRSPEAMHRSTICGGSIWYIKIPRFPRKIRAFLLKLSFIKFFRIYRNIGGHFWMFRLPCTGVESSCPLLHIPCQNLWPRWLFGRCFPVFFSI